MIKILVCHPTAQIFNVPCVVQLAESIASEEGHDVHFVRINSSRSATVKGEFSSRVLSHVYPVEIGSRKEAFRHWFIGYALYTLRLSSRIKPDLFIGMGSKGLAVAWLLSRLTSRPFFYYNLEFYTSVNRPFWYRITNSIERLFLARCKLLIIHDENRCNIYKGLIGYHDVKCAIFPNAPIPSDNAADVDYVKSLLKMVDGKKYIIYAGGLYPKVGLEGLSACLDRLSDEWCLLLQSSDGVDKIPRTDDVVRLLSSSRIVINTNPLTPPEYAALLSMCHIGIAFYRNEDPNMCNVGLSSGKIAAYWKHGLPVLVNDIPFYNELFATDKGGAIYDSFENIASPLLRVISDYDAHHKRALYHFKKYFSLGSYSRVINDAIGELSKSC